MWWHFTQSGDVCFNDGDSDLEYHSAGPQLRRYNVRFEGVDNNFVVKVLYKQLSLSRVGESHAIRMMISGLSNVRIPMYE